MVRKRKVESINSKDLIPSADEDLTQNLGEKLDEFLMMKYGDYVPPKPILTPTGIRHLDAILGGGISSSAPVMITSTPETGKSTFAFQFSKVFQTIHPNSIIVYIDVEGSGDAAEVSPFQLSRLETFGLNNKRFMYKHLKMDLDKVFELINDMIEAKIKFEQSANKSINLMFVWDSLAATQDKRIHESDSPNQMIGKKAMTLTFLLNKNKYFYAFHRVTFLIIDQVRAHFKIDQYSPSEKSVGIFKDYKAATSVMSLQHIIGQWIYLSKKGIILPGKDGIDVSGWYLDIITEKNKYISSSVGVTCVFDKIRGIDKFWSEYYFLSHLTAVEEKMGEQNIGFPLVIKTSGPMSYIEIPNLETGEKFISEKFYRTRAKQLYEENEEFQKIFDYAVDISVRKRITEGIFRIVPDKLETLETDDTSSEDQEESII